MENMRQGLAILFIVFAKESNIHELDINELRDNFKTLIQMEQYQKLFGAYEYDEYGICIQLEKELHRLLKLKQIHLYKNMLYIYNVPTYYMEDFNEEFHVLFYQMVTDYIQLNMQKQKVKVG